MTFLARLIIAVIVSFNLAPYAVLAQSNASSTATSSPQAPLPTCQLGFLSGNALSNSITIPVGGSVTLAWSSANAVNGTISSVGQVGPSGSINLLPPATAQTTFTGVFVSSAGSSSLPCSATVHVAASGGAGTVTTNAPQPTASAPTAAPAPSTGSASAPQSSLVPCGTSDTFSTNSAGATSCNACSLVQLGQNIINFAIGLAIPIAAGLFAWAGIMMYASGDAAAKRDEAKKIFTNTLVGFLIALCGWLIIDTFLHAIINPNVFPQSNWFQISCKGARPGTIPGQNTSTINDILGGLPVGNTAGLSTGGNNSAAYACPAGTTLTINTDTTNSNDIGACVNASGATVSLATCANGQPLDSNGYCLNPDGSEAAPNLAPTTGGGITTGSKGVAQCSSDNPNCSVNYLKSLGLSNSQANIMSCIAVTENGGGAVGCSGTGPCGTFQISQTNWNQYAPANCQASSFGGNITAAQNNASCNAQTMTVLVNKQGYQPWTCPGCNSYAQTCVNNYSGS